MKHSQFIILALGVVGFVESNPNNFPPPVVPHNCGFPDCSIPSNRYHEKALFPHPDPEKYYQCVPFDINTWLPMERYCICGLVFNPKLARCSFWWSEDWEPICDWSSPPLLTACDQPHKDKWPEW